MPATGKQLGVSPLENFQKITHRFETIIFQSLHRFEVFETKMISVQNCLFVAQLFFGLAAWEYQILFIDVQICEAVCPSAIFFFFFCPSTHRSDKCIFASFEKPEGLPSSEAGPQITQVSHSIVSTHLWDTFKKSLFRHQRRFGRGKGVIKFKSWSFLALVLKYLAGFMLRVDKPKAIAYSNVGF